MKTPASLWIIHGKGRRVLTIYPNCCNVWIEPFNTIPSQFLLSHKPPSNPFLPIIFIGCPPSCQPSAFSIHFVLMVMLEVISGRTPSAFPSLSEGQVTWSFRVPGVWLLCIVTTNCPLKRCILGMANDSNEVASPLHTHLNYPSLSTLNSNKSSANGQGLPLLSIMVTVT